MPWIMYGVLCSGNFTASLKSVSHVIKLYMRNRTFVRVRSNALKCDSGVYP